MKTSIKIVDDEASIREQVKLVLGADKYALTEAGSLADLRRSLSGPAPALVILDLRLSDGNALDVLPELKQKSGWLLDSSNSHRSWLWHI